jgi:dihydroorotase
MVGESEEVRLMAPDEAIDVINANRDIIVGIKVRVGIRSSGKQGIAPLKVALKVADAVNLPIMCHIDNPPPTYEEVLEMLRPGDILTHAFRPPPNMPCTPEGEVQKAVLDARQRGVLFDIGHGKGALSFDVARKMFAKGFYPDTISSDIHTLCMDGPAFDQATTLSKFLCLGMELPEVLKATTYNSAKALRRPELGCLKPGAVGDATILSVREGKFDYFDVTGERMVGDRRIVSEGVVLSGRWWHPRYSETLRNRNAPGSPVAIA